MWPGNDPRLLCGLGTRPGCYVTWDKPYHNNFSFHRELERQSLPHTVPDTSQSHVAAGRGGRGGTRPLSANTTRERAQKSLDESAKRLKAIEVR